MPKMTYQVIATDLDSTFMHDGMTIAALNIQMVQQAAADRVHFVIASGRQAKAIGQVQAKVGVSGAKVCLNGAYVVSASGQVLVAAPVAPKLLPRLFEVAQAASVNMMLYRAEGVYRYEVTHSLAWRAAFLVHGRGRNRLFHTSTQMQRLLRQEHIYKVGFNHPEHAVLVRLRTQLETLNGITLVWASPNFLEVTVAGVDKLSGLAALVADWGLTLADVVAFGDYENDLAMLTGVGCGVAMSNALPEVKVVAQEVVPNDDHSGVGRTLRQMHRDN